MRYLVLFTNNEGGRPAAIHDTLEAAKQAVRADLTAPDSNPPLEEDERAEMERDLAECDGTHVQSIRGSDAWKETVYIAPLAE